MRRPSTFFSAALTAAALGAAATLFSAADAQSAPAAATWAGDTVHSFVLFKIKHLGTSWSWGRFNDFTVSVDTDEAGTAISGVAFTVKTESVDTGNAKRDGHLRGPDFLSTKQFPEMSFKSTKVKPAEGGGAEVTGDLTLHGVTKPVTVTVLKTGAGKGMDGGDLLGYEATFSLKRTDFGMTNMVGPVGDDVAVTIAVELAKK